MDLTWNLDTLYTSFDSEKFKGDVELLNQHIANLNQWAEKNLKDSNRATFKIEEFLKFYNKYKSLYSCLFLYSYLILSADSSNVEAMDVLDDMEDKDSSVIETFVTFNKWLKDFNNIDELIDASPYLIEHRFYIKELLLQSKYLLSEDVEVVITKMQSTGSRMDYETLTAMFSAIKERLPIFHEYYHKKAEILGHKVSLPFYDIFAPVGDANTKISYLDARDLIVSSFKTFSEELADFAKKAFDDRWIDAEPRTGKGNYGLDVDIFPIKESRIMTSFTGNFSDIGVLAHEIGHAYHSYCLRNEEMLNTDYPNPIAETASIFCETIVNNALLNILPINEGLSILEKSISDVGYYIVDFYARYLFENKLFERRKSGQLSVEELNELMLSCMIEAYGDSIDVETIHPYMWMNKIGYYMGGNEFLNFPYSFGVIFSKGVYAEYIKKGEAFVSQYNNFLSATGKNNILDSAKMIDIDVHSIDFWRNALTLIQKDFEEFISRV